MSDTEKTWTLKHWLWTVSITVGGALITGGIYMILEHEVALNSIADTVNDMKPKVEAVHDSVNRMKEREKSTEKQLDKIEKDVDVIKKDTSSTASDVRYLKQVIERQTVQ